MSNLPTIGGIKELSPLEAKLLDQPQPEKSLLVKIADAYYSPKSFECHGRLYEWLGVKCFKDKLTKFRRKRFNSYLEKQFGSNYFLNQHRDLSALQKFEEETKSNEVVHLIPLIGSVYWAGTDLFSGDYIGSLAWTAVFTLSGFIVMLQRYNRNRIYNTIEVLRENYRKAHPLEAV